MQAATISLHALYASGKWRAEVHVHHDEAFISRRYSLVPLSAIVVESKAAEDPKKMEGEFWYVGLENVESITGHVSVSGKKTSADVKSRSKKFSQGSVLYGRLRPYLRKAMLVEPPICKGLCSTEFVILEPDPNKILPEFLREILVTEEVTNQLIRLQSGSALPRVSGKDLLSVQIPLPPIDQQEQLVKELASLKKKRKEYLVKADKCTRDAKELLEAAIT